MTAMNRLLTADYRDGRVRIGGKSYPAGTYAVHLLNQFYKNDTAARIRVFMDYNWRLQAALEVGFLPIDDFQKAGTEMLHIFRALPWLKPFDTWDMEAEKDRVRNLFCEENSRQLLEYFHRRAKVMALGENEAQLHLLPREYDQQFFKETAALLAEVETTLRFYDTLSGDANKAFHQLSAFVCRADEADRLDEAHLLPIALEELGAAPFPVKTEYVPYQKTAKSKTSVVARRLYFESYYSFILTDFYEGLHYGHYPRRCEICRIYFLMTSARRQQYCSGMAPYALRGKKVSCRQYAAAMKRKELAENDPIVDLYTRRCNAIRSEKSRGAITASFAVAAIDLARDNKFRAISDPEYANTQYAEDMARENLYMQTDKQLNH